MLALLVFLLVLFPVLGLLIRDRNRIAATRDVERGFHVISQRVSGRLQFRQPLRSDLDFFVEMAMDPTAAEANGWNGEEPAVIRGRFASRKAFKAFQANEMVAFERASGSAIGTATFSPSPVGPPGSNMIGIHVHPSFRARGYGRELMAAAITLMQHTPGPLYVGTRVTNLPMQRIMQELQYEAEPETHPHRAPDGNEYDAYWYRCDADTHPPAGLRDI